MLGSKKRESIKYRCTLIEIQQIPRPKSGIRRSVQRVPAPAFAGCSVSFDFMPNHRPVFKTDNLHAEITKYGSRRSPAQSLQPPNPLSPREHSLDASIFQRNISAEQTILGHTHQTERVLMHGATLLQSQCADVTDHERQLRSRKIALRNHSGNYALPRER